MPFGIEMLLLLVLGSSGSCELVLALAPARGGDPSALDVGGALESPALAAGSASHVGTVLLRLVATVLAAHASTSWPHHHNRPRR